MKSTVTAADVAGSVRALGVEAGDLVLVHSSLSSLGYVEGGAQAVIDGFEAVLGPEGTLVMPTLVQKDFADAYRTWHLDKPSDVGYITEYFRKLPGVLRSDQATHSVAARGPLAWELTHEHTAYGPRIGPHGDYAYCLSSPWEKMYVHRGKVVFIGVTMRKNTYKHLIESRFVEDLLSEIPAGAQRDALAQRITRFGKPGVWPFYDGEAMQAALDALGMVRRAPCGDATLLCVDIHPMVELTLGLLKEQAEKWYGSKPEVMEWIRDAKAAARPSECATTSQ